MLGHGGYANYLLFVDYNFRFIEFCRLNTSSSMVITHTKSARQQDTKVSAKWQWPSTFEIGLLLNGMSILVHTTLNL